MSITDLAEWKAERESAVMVANVAQNCELIGHLVAEMKEEGVVEATLLAEMAAVVGAKIATLSPGEVAERFAYALVGACQEATMLGRLEDAAEVIKALREELANWKAKAEARTTP